MSRIITRPVPLRVHDQLVREGLHPVLARVCASRGISRRGELEDALSGLIPPCDLLNSERAASLLADAIAAGKRMLIVADYDCDGATACAARSCRAPRPSSIPTSPAARFRARALRGSA